MSSSYYHSDLTKETSSIVSNTEGVIFAQIPFFLRRSNGGHPVRGTVGGTIAAILLSLSLGSVSLPYLIEFAVSRQSLGNFNYCMCVCVSYSQTITIGTSTVYTEKQTRTCA